MFFILFTPFLLVLGLYATLQSFLCLILRLIRSNFYPFHDESGSVLARLDLSCSSLYEEEGEGEEIGVVETSFSHWDKVHWNSFRIYRSVASVDFA